MAGHLLKREGTYAFDSKSPFVRREEGEIKRRPGRVRSSSIRDCLVAVVVGGRERGGCTSGRPVCSFRTKAPISCGERNQYDRRAAGKSMAVSVYADTRGINLPLALPVRFSLLFFFSLSLSFFCLFSLLTHRLRASLSRPFFRSRSPTRECTGLIGLP